jgi:hypothetical protein
MNCACYHARCQAALQATEAETVIPLQNIPKHALLIGGAEQQHSNVER